MSLEQLTERAIQTRRLDHDTAHRISRFLDGRPHLTPDEYEALCRLGRALKTGAVEQGDDGQRAGHA